MPVAELGYASGAVHRLRRKAAGLRTAPGTDLHSSRLSLRWVSIDLSGSAEAEARGTGFADDEAGHLMAQGQANFVVDARVHTAIDPAQAGFRRSRVVAVERPDDARHDVLGHPDAIVLAEETA